MIYLCSVTVNRYEHEPCSMQEDTVQMNGDISPCCIAAVIFKVQKQ